MNRKWVVHTLDVAVIVLVGYFVTKPIFNRAPKPPIDPFIEHVNLEPLRKIAVHDVGRIKSFDSYARSIVSAIAGPKGIPGQEPVYSYLDLMLNRAAYHNQNIIYVKKAIRRDIARVMDQMGMPADEISDFVKRGMISDITLAQAPMRELLARLDMDIIRTAKFVQRVRNAQGLSSPHELSARFDVIPPPGGTEKDPWLAGEAVWGLGFIADNHNHASVVRDLPALRADMRQTLTTDWNKLTVAWRARDAEAATAAIASLASALAEVEPSLYPPPDKLQLESWYFRMHAFVWDWVIYVLSVLPLLLFVIYRWRRALIVGVIILVIAFAIHTASLGIRWYLAGRIPNSNMFEAILAATWLGVASAFVLEFLVRKTAMRGLFFLGSGVGAMIAMMCQHFLPTDLRSDIDNAMPVLDSVWLYIHTNVIIWSYALIVMAALTSLLYLRYRAGGGDPHVAKAGGAGSLILDGTSKGDTFLRENPATIGQVLDAATLVTMELSFVMLWAGVVMGAIWADQSWGRPWGWDPKEVFALCTFIIFMIVFHVRFKVRDKGFWTAVLAIVGCGVMLFNWIVINFAIRGLHSYA